MPAVLTQKMYHPAGENATWHLHMGQDAGLESEALRLRL